MDFLPHFDIIVEREIISCNTSVSCTPIRMETKETSMNNEIRKSGHDDPIHHPATPTSGRDTSYFPQFY